MGTGANATAFAEICIKKMPNSFIYIMGRRLSKLKAAFQDMQVKNEVKTWKRIYSSGPNFRNITEFMVLLTAYSTHQNTPEMK